MSGWPRNGVAMSIVGNGYSQQANMHTIYIYILVCTMLVRYLSLAWLVPDGNRIKKGTIFVV